jgi:hypothetical protein
MNTKSVRLNLDNREARIIAKALRYATNSDGAQDWLSGPEGPMDTICGVIDFLTEKCEKSPVKRRKDGKKS